MNLAQRLRASDLARRLRGLRQSLPHGYGQTSYAQEGEDLILGRVVEPGRRGFYIDVGACHPLRFSNTYRFYRLGWSGVNIDATPGSMRLFRRRRPRDLNLELAIGEDERPRAFYAFNDPALNTFDPDCAQKYVRNGYRLVAQHRIVTRPLRSVLREHLSPGQAIDFLSVDVEERDLEVLRSNDWGRYRPRVVLVEIAGLGLSEVVDTEIHQFLHAQGYASFAKTVNTVFFKAL